MDNSFNIEKFIQEFEKGCSKVQKKMFNKGETIINYSDNHKQICILISGTANLVKYDYNGNKFVTERFFVNSVFGDIFYQINTNSEFIVEAKENCEVLIFPYKNLSDKCKTNCSFHKDLIEYFPNLIINKIRSLTSRLELLSIRSTREKLLNYFDMLSKQNGKSFTLPFSITELANYLAVDRSSMSRELSNLKKEKIIKQERNKITLL